jgi:hypothetical protein
MGSILTNLWLGAARGRRKLRGDPDHRAAREATVRELAPGKSFADVGGMWSIHGRIAFLAEEAGASRTILFDGMDPSPEFEAERERRSSSVSFVQADLHDAAIAEELGALDIVWCTGVLYHSPNPFLLLQHLRRMTAELLYLGTLTIPEVPGVEQGCVFYPGASQASQTALGRAFGGGHPGMDAPFDDQPMMGYANTWWGISLSALRSMLELAGFELVEQRAWSPFHADVIARPVGPDNLIPPPDFARKRGQARSG